MKWIPSEKGRTTGDPHDRGDSQWLFPVGKGVHSRSWGFRWKINQHRADLWTCSDFCIEEKIGSGSFGRVYCALYDPVHSSSSNNNKENPSELRRGKRVAIKSFSKYALLESGALLIDLLRNEISIHSHLSHPNIVSMIGYFHNCKSISLVLEYAPCGDLFEDILSDMSSHERMKKTRQAILQLCEAVAYLSSVQVAHRDIKPENVLIFNKKGSRTIKLCDFGWATWWKPGTYQSTFCGTPEFIPPEMLRKDSYAPEYVDSWALGVLTMELLQIKTPFCPSSDGSSSEEHSVHTSSIFDRIQNFEGEPLDDNTNPDLKDFVTKLMCIEPSDRMSAEAALRHRFLKPSDLGNMNCSTDFNKPTVAQRCQLFEHMFTMSRR